MQIGVSYNKLVVYREYCRVSKWTGLMGMKMGCRPGLHFGSRRHG
jgi:hypothetical protein